MSGQPPVRYSAAWLGVRETADRRARSPELAATVARDLRAAGPLVVHDLGCGTGAMGRWLAPLLPGPQEWVLHDLDPELLRLAVAGMPTRAADGLPVTARPRPGDLTRLGADDLEGAALVTASALLDLLTAGEIGVLAAACARARCPALLTLCVAGSVRLTPADPLDAAVAAAFDAHQRRTLDGRRLLGPDAVGVATGAFGELGAGVSVRPSPWRLGRDDAELTAAWLRGWVGAAQEQQPELELAAYHARRLDQAAAGTLAVTVGHEDLLARWE